MTETEGAALAFYASALPSVPPYYFQVAPDQEGRRGADLDGRGGRGHGPFKGGRLGAHRLVHEMHATMAGLGTRA